jgi:hypothetical protein
MAEIAIFDGPGNSTIVACAAELSIYDLEHIDVVSACLECEAQITVANLASKPDPVKPVWEDDRAHARIVGVLVHDHVAVLGRRSVEIAMRGQCKVKEYA